MAKRFKLIAKCFHHAGDGKLRWAAEWIHVNMLPIMFDIRISLTSSPPNERCRSGRRSMLWPQSVPFDVWSSRAGKPWWSRSERTCLHWMFSDSIQQRCQSLKFLVPMLCYLNVLRGELHQSFALDDAGVICVVGGDQNTLLSFRKLQQRTKSNYLWECQLVQSLAARWWPTDWFPPRWSHRICSRSLCWICVVAARWPARRLFPKKTTTKDVNNIVKWKREGNTLLISTSARFAPFWWNIKAISLPMPCPAPVMSTVLPETFFSRVGKMRPKKALTNSMLTRTNSNNNSMRKLSMVPDHYVWHCFVHSKFILSLVWRCPSWITRPVENNSPK